MYYCLITIFIFCITFKSAVCDQIGLNCSENDVHCVQKREEMHWCTDKGCSTCSDHTCVLSCKGFSCGLCPRGDCCNGMNCNACFNNSCCLTPSCNYCIRTCQTACNNNTFCEKICTLQCQNSGHNVFVVPSTSEKETATVYIKGIGYKGDITSRQFTSSDTTAIITINGVNSVALVLFLPQSLQDACIKEGCDSECTGNECKKCTGSRKCKCLKECQSKCHQNCLRSCYEKCVSSTPSKEFNYYNTLTPGCCHVVHPQVCYSSQMYGQPYCYKRSHRECSTLCTSKFIHIQSDHAQLMYNRCYYIQVYPYVYCGNYAIQNCDSCYVCNNQYSPDECVKTSSCPNKCRRNFLPFQPNKKKETNTPIPIQNSVSSYLNLYPPIFRYPYYGYSPNQYFGISAHYG